jgi:hypothetical protein
MSAAAKMVEKTLGARVIEFLEQTETPVTAVTAPGETDAGVLQDVYVFLLDFLAYPSSHAAVAHTLWIAHTHLMDVWESTPRLAFLSAEPESGKTKALELTELLVPRPLMAINASTSYVFRKISDKEGMPTLLWDEIDTIFGPKAREHEDIRGVLNAGHRRGAVAGRCVVRGKEVFTEELPAYCAVAMAGLGNLPDTILSRSVVIRMRRRSPEERLKPYRRRLHAPIGHLLRARLARWADAVSIGDSWPEMPPGITDRDADCWEALLAIADAAGGPWPELARVAAVTLVTQREQGAGSLGIRLLTDLRAVFGGKENMSTRDILDTLCLIDESPWGDLKGRPLDARKLSQLLRPYDIHPTTIRTDTSPVKGYKREDLHDAWLRYLGAPSVSPASVTSVTSVSTVTEKTL